MTYLLPFEDVNDIEEDGEYVFDGRSVKRMVEFENQAKRLGEDFRDLAAMTNERYETKKRQTGVKVKKDAVSIITDNKTIFNADAQAELERFRKRRIMAEQIERSKGKVKQ